MWVMLTQEWLASSVLTEWLTWLGQSCGPSGRRLWDGEASWLAGQGPWVCDPCSSGFPEQGAEWPGRSLPNRFLASLRLPIRIPAQSCSALSCQLGLREKGTQPETTWGLWHMAHQLPQLWVWRSSLQPQDGGVSTRAGPVGSQ